MTRISILLIALLALVASACSSDQGGSSASPTRHRGVNPRACRVRAAESEAAGETVGAFPSFDMNGDPELAARFPDTVGGSRLQVQSFRGDVFMAGGGSDPSFTRSSTRSAPSSTTSRSPSAGRWQPRTPLSVGAFRILGASEDDLEREFIAASEESGDVTGLEQTSVGGKDVWSAADPTGTGTSVVHLHQGRHALLPDRQ